MRIAIICEKYDAFFGVDMHLHVASVERKYKNVVLVYYETALEGEIINVLHEEGFKADGIILCPGSFCYSSVSIRDAVAGISSPVIVIGNKEDGTGMQTDIISGKAVGSIKGLGMDGLELGIEWFIINSGGHL